ncbi:MAG TPA: hypothetical protein ENJ35_05490 [Gammaproteobacteria bacterium]|nr:hypothetical protein [Gammaproteobacteria bacterium]
MRFIAVFRSWFPALAVVSYLIGTTLPESRGTKIAALMIVARLLISNYAWLRKTSGRIAVAILIVSLFVGGSHGLLAIVYGGIERYVGVVILVLSISFLRLPLDQIRFDIGLFSKQGTRRGTGLPAITTASSAISPLLNLGTIALFGGLLETHGAQAEKVSSAVTRGVGAALLVSPTFAPTAIVLREFPDVTWASTLPIGLPLFVATLVLAWSRRDTIVVSWVQNKKRGYPPFHLALIVVFMGLILVGCRVFAQWSIVTSVSIAAIGSVYLWTYVVARSAIPRLTVNPRKHIGNIWPAIEAEAALFVVAGILSSAISTNSVLSASAQSVVGEVTSPVVLYVIVLAGMPLITILGIHPIVPFVILVHLIDGAALGLTPPEMYVFWVVGWIQSMMVSPVSALNISASAFFHVSPWTIGIRENVPYAFAFGAISLALFWTIGG